MTNTESLKTALNRQTAKINWSELERFYAKGDVLWVDSLLDLVDVAEKLAMDNQVAFNQWITKEQVHKVNDQQALVWSRQPSKFWAVVVDPWVLIQEYKD